MKKQIDPKILVVNLSFDIFSSTVTSLTDYKGANSLLNEPFIFIASDSPVLDEINEAGVCHIPVSGSTFVSATDMPLSKLFSHSELLKLSAQIKSDAYKINPLDLESGSLIIEHNDLSKIELEIYKLETPLTNTVVEKINQFITLLGDVSPLGVDSGCYQSISSAIKLFAYQGELQTDCITLQYGEVKVTFKR